MASLLCASRKPARSTGPASFGSGYAEPGTDRLTPIRPRRGPPTAGAVEIAYAEGENRLVLERRRWA